MPSLVEISRVQSPEQLPTAPSAPEIVEAERDVSGHSTRPRKIFDLLPERRAEQLERERGLREALLDAIRQDNEHLIRDLVSQGATLLPHYLSGDAEAWKKVGSLTTKTPRNGMVNPVDWAALHNRPRAALQLLELGDILVSSGGLSRASSFGVDLARQCRCAVHYAARVGHMELLRGLLGRHASIGHLNSSGETPLRVAIRFRQETAAQLLLKHQAWALECHKPAVIKLVESQNMLGILSPSERPVRPVTRTAFVSPARDSRAVKSATLSFFNRDERLTEGMEATMAPGTMATVSIDVSADSIDRPATSPGAASDACSYSYSTRDFVEVKSMFIKAIRGNMIGALRELITTNTQHICQLELDLGYGERGNCVDWAVVKGFPDKAVIFLELCDGAGIGNALAAIAKAAFFWAIVEGYTQVLHALLSRGCDVGRTHHLWSRGDSGLDIAVFGSRGPEIELLMSYGAWRVVSVERREQLSRWARHRPAIWDALQKGIKLEEEKDAIQQERLEAEEEVTFDTEEADMQPPAKQGVTIHEHRLDADVTDLETEANDDSRRVRMQFDASSVAATAESAPILRASIVDANAIVAEGDSTRNPSDGVAADIDHVAMVFTTQKSTASALQPDLDKGPACQV